MEVQGVTPQRLKEVADASIVSGQIDANGNLVLTTAGGQQRNAGKIIQPITAWPVGSIYIGVTSTNPAQLLGGGTWERFANGRVLTGVSEGDAAFNAALKTGGYMNHTLTVDQMPQHNHGGATGHQSHDHAHAGVTTTPGGHEHLYTMITEPRTVTGNGAATVANWALGNGSTGGGGGHSHNIQTGGVDQNHTHAIGNSGGGQSFSIMQPYIAVYIWRRTA